MKAAIWHRTVTGYIQF